jgi:hypothetical protein
VSCDLPDVPLWSELGENEGQCQILEILSGDVAVGRPILTAPDVPADRVRALRKAFDETLADPQFIAAANQASVYINPMGGEEVQAMVEKTDPRKAYGQCSGGRPSSKARRKPGRRRSFACGATDRYRSGISLQIDSTLPAAIV